MRFPINRHRLPQLVADAAIVAAAWFLAFGLRFDPSIPVYYDRYLDGEIVGLLIAIKLSVFALFGFYNRWWRYVSTRDMWGAARGVTLPHSAFTSRSASARPADPSVSSDGL